MQNVLWVIVILLYAVCGPSSACASTAGSPSSPPADLGYAILLTADPDAVMAEATLTYRVEFGPEAVVRPLTLHLPKGVAEATTSGKGWICTVMERNADSYQAAAHPDADCSNALLGLATPPLTVRVRAPTTPGPIRACVVASAKGDRQGTVVCAGSTVVR